MTLAAKFIVEDLHISRRRLAQEYRLNRQTLSKIIEGKNADRSSERYMPVFVNIINDRRTAEWSSPETKSKCSEILMNIALVQNGVSTDAERAKFKKVKNLVAH